MMKPLKTLLKSSSFYLLFCFLLLSCAPKCNENDLKILRAAENGKLNIVKKYLENGGDPLLNCSQFGGKGNFTSAISSDSDLYFSICKSKSLPIIKYYLTQNISDNIKNKMLYFFSDVKEEDIVKLLIKENAHFLEFSESCIYKNVITNYKKLNNLNYNFNWVDPKDGNNILMKYAKCPATENEEELLELIQYFVEIGVKIDIKNKEGKTAYDIAENIRIKEYLKTLN